jgi:hypothetical protein
MSTRSIVEARSLYRVTPEGHAAALAESSCVCTMTFEFGLLQCGFCGTVYGAARELSYFEGSSRGEQKRS